VAATTNEGANVAHMTALVNHPVWLALSAFGNPYPPFDFNSGMGAEPVGRSDAQALGLLDGDVEEMMEPRAPISLNEGLEASPGIVEDMIREAVASQLGGLAEWRGDVLAFTDPNGSTPYSTRPLHRHPRCSPPTTKTHISSGFLPCLWLWLPSLSV